ncbi:hypothetical protein NOR51B_1 [Luminiphilus syltensis NOR5-1B]|uniref:Uncharacterized protein n=1 Tax=Luminiphilus syltensis NOR5-1B TaxID=565045 RepID=B8KX99_9GAMM|nr:hypothetical protein NOR51B_1 [Luminiphilus syltensis NOR5-1B]
MGPFRTEYSRPLAARYQRQIDKLNQLLKNRFVIGLGFSGHLIA